ncbi:hypothetical protein HXX76_002119 [Chlamydomonas incerta]|uniref:Amine oxidase n=1 Tax=Chlamydomonas incerta TaxID=51695 RepID=A0A835WAI4_CHLIN|nr:hypothetical protein HXX76_002119 [Chlamydomonas incerta]|eukprot:KAG2443775.1 hypothetical protein HXX76_002119 [Chlamydomonas incerta]
MQRSQCSVRDFLLSQPKLGLVSYDEAGPTDNVLFTVEMLPPAKADMLAHIDGGGPAPPRRAYAALFLFNQTDGARCLQVEVGPLPTPTYYKPIRHSKQTPDIHIHSRPGSEPEYSMVDALMAEAFKTLDPIVAEAWFTMMRKVEGLYLHPIGLEWYVDKIFYANRMWNTSEEIAAWYEANNRTTPGFKPWNPVTEEDYRFSTFNPRTDTAPHLPLGGRPGPRQYEPAGKRFNVNGKHVSWMGWDLNLGMRSTAGTRLWDVRFNGTRVAYEISLQEAAAAYGADPASSPFQASTFYFDSSWGMGPSHLQLVPGSDCPDTAVYFDYFHLWNGHDVKINANSACVFELDLGQRLRRHHQHHTRPKFAASIKSYALVVRSISTVYNYDYQWDHVFYTDGTIEVKVQAFGYLQTGPYDSDAYSYPISPDAGGTLHDHVGHWKVDLDIAGQSNSLVRSTIVPQMIETPWHPTVKSTWSKRVKRTVAETEQNATLFINPDTPTYMVMVNEDAPNVHGYPRGYRIDHKSYTHSLIPDDAWIMQAASFMKYHVAVTARKEDEPTSTTIFDQATPKEPVVRFEDYIDGDSVRQQDLVAWVSAGTWHIPVGEDAPNTPSTAHAVGFVLRPFNYFDEDAALHTREVTIIRNDFETGDAAVVDTGMMAPRDCVPHAGGLTVHAAVDSFDSPTDDYDA